MKNSEKGSPGQNKSIDITRLEADLDDLDNQREQLEQDQLGVRRMGEVILPLVSILAPPFFVFFALFAAFRLDIGNANTFFYAVIIYSFTFSGIFGVLAYISRRALIQTQFTFVSVFSDEVVAAYPEYKKRLTEPRRLAEWITRRYDSYVPSTRWQLHRLFLPAYAVITFAIALSGFAYFMIEKSGVLENTLLNQISFIGVSLFVVSYLAFLSLGRRAVVDFHEPRIWDSQSHVLRYVDYSYKNPCW